GLAGLSVGHPFVKVRLQSRELAARYNGTWNCLVTIVKQEKILGLYKGMAGVAAINALVFGVYGHFIELQQRHMVFPSNDLTQPSLTNVFIAGVAAGSVTSFITGPMELVKIQLQNQTHTTTSKLATRYTGPIDCFMKIFQKGGIRACYAGLTPTMLREISFGPYFVTFEVISRLLRSLQPNPNGQLSANEDDLSGWQVVLAGGSAGIMAWCSTYAADVLKTRIQSEPSRYRGVIDCARQCYKEEGWRIFFRGLNATIVRAFPSNAATFVAYTWTMKMMSPVNLQEDVRPLTTRAAC
ncbi:mitochondrial carrier domain-containing protein, partial [Umbelopsis sp. AD052]